MLSEKQFRERAKSELRQIGNQVLSLATERDIYCKLECEVIQPNPQLCGSRSPVLDLLRGAYTDAMAARVLHLLDGEDGGVSLPRLLRQLADYPQLLQDKTTEREFIDDRAALAQAAANLKDVIAPHIAHHEKTLSSLTAMHRELDQAIDLMVNAVKTYYWIVGDSYIDLDVRHSEDPMSIFQFAWAVPVLAG